MRDNLQRLWGDCRESVLAQAAVEEEFFLDEPCEHVVVAAALGFGDQGAHLALATLHVPMLQSVQCIFNLLCGRALIAGGGLRLLCGLLESASQQDAARLIGCGIERVRRRRCVGEGFEYSGGWEPVVPLWVLGKTLNCECARRVAFWQYKSA